MTPIERFERADGPSPEDAEIPYGCEAVRRPGRDERVTRCLAPEERPEERPRADRLLCPFLASLPHPAFHAAVSKCLRCGAELPPHGDCTACEPGALPARPPPEILSRELPLDRRQTPPATPPRATPEPFRLDPPATTGPIAQIPMLTPIPRPGSARDRSPPVLTPLPGPRPVTTGSTAIPRPGAPAPAT